MDVDREVKIGRPLEEHLEVLQSLYRSVRDGLEALTLGHFEDYRGSLQEQEELCCFLRQAIKESAKSITDNGRKLAIRDLLLSIAIAHKRLARLNRTYAALLRKSSRTVKLLAAYRSSRLNVIDGTDMRRLEWLAEV